MDLDDVVISELGHTPTAILCGPTDSPTRKHHLAKAFQSPDFAVGWSTAVVIGPANDHLSSVKPFSSSLKSPSVSAVPTAHQRATESTRVGFLGYIPAHAALGSRSKPEVGNTRDKGRLSPGLAAAPASRNRMEALQAGTTARRAMGSAQSVPITEKFVCTMATSRTCGCGAEVAAPHAVAVCESRVLLAVCCELVRAVGCGDSQIQTEPLAFFKDGVAALAATTRTAVVVTGAGAVHTVANTADELTQSEIPRPFSGGTPVTAVSCGKQHTVLLTEAGTVYSFGFDTHGQLGHGECTNSEVLVARLVDALDGVPMKQVAAGGWHTMILGEGGEVYTCGRDHQNQLGRAVDIESPASIPGLIDFEETLTQVAAGAGHSAALTHEGRLVLWGSNRFEQLGWVTSSAALRTPTVADTPNVFRGVHCGHSSNSVFAVHCPPLRDDVCTLAVGRGCERVAAVVAASGLPIRLVAEEAIQGADSMWVLTHTNLDTLHKFRVASMLHNTAVLSDKASLARLTTLMKEPSLKSLVLKGVPNFESWCRTQFQGALSNPLWFLKDPVANGGRSVWVVGPLSWRAVAEQARQLYGSGSDVELVLQKAVDPDLWEGKYKYHLRVYAVVRGDMEVLVYQDAFAHVANQAYSPSFDPHEGYSREVHITNVAINATSGAGPLQGYPVVALDRDRPDVWGRICAKLVDLIAAADPFLGPQRSARHFAHLGCDFMVDKCGEPWLLEINTPPCLGSQSSASADDEAVGKLLNPQIQELLELLYVPGAKSSSYTQASRRWARIKAGNPDFEPATSAQMKAAVSLWERSLETT